MVLNGADLPPLGFACPKVRHHIQSLTDIPQTRLRVVANSDSSPILPDMGGVHYPKLVVYYWIGFTT